MRKSFLFIAAAFVFLTSVALAQYNPYDSGYYGQTGQDNEPYSPNGQPIIYVFFNNEPCDSCLEAIQNIEQSYNNNGWQGQYNFSMINYEEEEAAGNYANVDNYNLYQPLSIVLQDVNENGLKTKFLKIPYDENFNPYTYQEVFMTEVSTFFTDYNDPYAPY